MNCDVISISYYFLFVNDSGKHCSISLFYDFLALLAQRVINRYYQAENASMLGHSYYMP